jgi:hypothetical protein
LVNGISCKLNLNYFVVTKVVLLNFAQFFFVARKAIMMHRSSKKRLNYNTINGDNTYEALESSSSGYFDSDDEDDDDDEAIVGKHRRAPMPIRGGSSSQSMPLLSSDSATPLSRVGLPRTLVGKLIDRLATQKKQEVQFWILDFPPARAAAVPTLLLEHARVGVAIARAAAPDHLVVRALGIVIVVVVVVVSCCCCCWYS